MFERNARTVSLLTLASRVLGLAREATLSRVFGAGPLMDAFFFAFMLPNLFRRLFGEGALASAFLPVYTKLDRDDPLVAQRLATVTLGALVVVLGGLVLAAEIALLAFGARDGHAGVVTRLVMITLPYTPLVCVVAILGAMLQVHGRFGPPAAAPIVLNVCMIGVAVGAGVLAETETTEGRLWHVAMTAASILLAGVLQVTWALAALRKHAWLRRGGLRDESVRSPFGAMLRQAGPMIIGLGVLQVNAFVDAIIASYPVTFGDTILGHDYPLTEGAMSAVSFAQRMYQFPLGVFGIAIATAIFPLLARQSDDDDAFGDTLRRGLRLVIFIGLPASVGLALVRSPLVGAVLEGGRFGAADTDRVAFVLLGYAPAVWAYSMTHVLTRAFYARGDAITPVKLAVAMVALNVVLNLTLIWTPLRESGLAWATAICAAVQSVLLLALARRYAAPLINRSVAASWAKTAAISLVMGLAVFAVSRTLPMGEGWWGTLGFLAALVIVGKVLVVVGAAALKMPELRWAIGSRTRG